MRRLILCLVLAACAPQGLRDQNVPITSIVAFDPAQFIGRWYVVEAVPGTDYTAFDYKTMGAQLSVDAYCSGGTRRGEVKLSGPGRMSSTLEGMSEELWVLWVDADYRTAVIGTPSGRIGMILNRGPDIPVDRLRAARDVMDWNGYNIGKLQALR